MSKIIHVLPPEPRRALEALAEFRFLTSKQAVNLGISKSETVMRDYVWHELEKRRSGKQALAESKKIGQFLPKVHYLTKRGAEELAEIYRLPPDAFTYPKGKVQFGEMFARHRFAQVDFHIGFRKWAHNWGEAVEVDFVDMDFDVSGSRRTGDFSKASEIKLPNQKSPIVADGIFGFHKGGTPHIYVMEVHRSTQTKAVSLQIAKYMEALTTGAVSFKYGWQVSPGICSVHTRPNVLKGVKAYLMNHPEFAPFKGAFVFNTTEQLHEDFTAGWTFADDSPAFPFKNPDTPNQSPFFE